MLNAIIAMALDNSEMVCLYTLGNVHCQNFSGLVLCYLLNSDVAIILVYYVGPA